MDRKLKAHFALSTVALIYGANYVIAKSVMPDPVEPNAFIAMRVLGAVLLFWLFSYRHVSIPDKKDWGTFLFCGLTGVVINQLLFFNGLALTSPINGSIIMTSNPILVMLLAAILMKQPISARSGTGVTLGATGAITLIISSNQSEHATGNITGDIFILVNSLSYALYIIKAKSLMAKYHPLNVVTWVFTIGLVFVLPFGGLGLTAVPWSELTSWQWFAVFFVIFCVTYLTYLLNTLALSVVSSATTSAYIYFQPLLAAIFSFLFSLWTGTDFSGEITLGKVCCTLLIFAGVYLVSSGERSKRNV
jgi:drug/metabolite transporter (DMT)-like permease